MANATEATTFLLANFSRLNQLAFCKNGAGILFKVSSLLRQFAPCHCFSLKIFSQLGRFYLPPIENDPLYYKNKNKKGQFNVIQLQYILWRLETGSTFMRVLSLFNEGSPSPFGLIMKECTDSWQNLYFPFAIN